MISDELSVLAVGDDFTLIKRRVIGTGSAMDLLDGGMFLIATYIPDMSVEEAELLRNAPMEVRIFREDDHAIYLVRFGDSPMIFELTFDPTLYPENKQQEILKSNLVAFVGVDSTTNETKTLRMANMPKAMHGNIVDILNKTKNYKGFYSGLYETFVEVICSRFLVEELWEIATPAGKMGE